MKILSFSGHRWHNAQPYTETQMLDFMGFLKQQLVLFFANPPHTAYSLDNIAAFVCGGAIGFDLAAQQFAIEHKIHLVIALSFEETVFMRGWSNTYKNILTRHLLNATDVVVVDQQPYYKLKYGLGDKYHPAKHQWRNEWMVDNSDETLFYWDECPKGGTANCMRYVKTQKHPFHNMYVAPSLAET